VVQTDTNAPLLSTVLILDYSLIIPGIRAGYRVNQAGSELSYLSGGFTLFSVNVDVAYSPDKVEDDSGDETSRSIIVNLGLELTF